MTTGKATAGRVWKRAATACAVFGAATVIVGGTASGAGVEVGAEVAAGENPAAARAIEVLATGDARAAEALPTDFAEAVPTDFAEVMGYSPKAVDGTLTHPDGSCSSPVPLPSEFDTACKAHDLGYDLLRYAHKSDGELGPWARRAVDQRLETDMHAACDTRADQQSRTFCFAMADVASAAVNGNSWRQHNLTPVDETAKTFALGSGAAALAVVCTQLAFARRRTRTATTSPSTSPASTVGR